MSTSTTESATGRAMPPVVYVPTTDDPDPHQRHIVMHHVEDGRTALYAYSAPDRLEDFYLPGSPWVLCDIPTLQRIHDETPYDLLFVDVDPGLREDTSEVTA
ncbi:SAV_915 family protein [Aeromicrobium yanjiei]|uniref:SseB protein N-terminal domain-containing protein n=1 Tax=Aeromicrobium yanjiei TaxID=2662028 RepID=A0A5Q2MIZ3_9ACTN|nr:SAV_915 family protein [Aeromicrobium yanjiei]QGG41769.1 hypothetical protein GEV26_10570 [Aeromicrobium yanjiei]